MNILSRFKYFLLLPFIALIFITICWSIADGFAYQAAGHERRWSIDGGMAEKSDWDAAIGWSKLAMKLDPYNPNYPEMVGRLYFWRFFIGDSPVESSEEAKSIADEGLAYLRDSIELRPTWPRAWSSFMRLKSVSGQIDNEFEQAWIQAVELGDWEPEVQTQLLEMGLIHWFEFNDSLRGKTVEIFIAMTSKPYSELRAIRVVDRLDAWPLVCDALVDPILMPLLMRRACQALPEDRAIPENVAPSILIAN